MLRGIYTGASGMVAQMHRMDALSNNLANVNVTGYKRDTAVFRSFPELMLRRMDDDGIRHFPLGSQDIAPVVGNLGTGVELNEVYTIFEQGALQETNNNFDLALEGEGFFAVQTPNGERYTRNGSFILNNEGILVTKEGFPVLGENGIIEIKENNFVVDEDGNIFHNSTYSGDPEDLVSMQENEWENTELVDTLRIVSFNRSRYLEKQGISLYRDSRHSGEAQTAQNDERPRVYQGFLESSNVNPVTQMVEMIEVNRAYEASQKMIQNQDGLTGKLFNEAIRV
ncbi:MAG: flagellar basal-body rod protein FlgF [Spirochaetia bacterium]